MYGGLFGMGSVSVPWTREAMAGLCTAVVRDWTLGILWALTENKPPAPAPMRLYFDLDMKFGTLKEVQAAEEAFPAVLAAIVQEIRRFFPDTDARVFRGMVMASGVRKCQQKVVQPGALHAGAGAGSGAGSVSADTSGGSSGATGGLTIHALLHRAAATGIHAGHAGAGAGAGAGSAAGSAASTAASAAASAGTITVYRAGIHIVFPELYVVVDQALMIAAAVVARLNADGLPCGSSTDWEECVDSGVYHEHRGLRWAWQVKHGTCGTCKGAKGTGGIVTGGGGVGSAGGYMYAGSSSSFSQRCATCGGSGMVANRSESMYTPRARVDARGELGSHELRRVVAPTEALLLEASVRGADCSIVPTPNWTLYAGHPCRPTLRVRHDTIEVVTGKPTAARVPRNGTVLDMSDPRRSTLVALVHKTNAMYAKLSLTNVYFIVNAKGQHSYLVYVKGSGETYCQFKAARAHGPGGDGVVSHHATRVHFRVTTDYIRQECKSKKCLGAVGPPVALVDSQKRALFGAGSVTLPPQQHENSGGSGSGSGSGSGAAGTTGSGGASERTETGTAGSGAACSMGATPEQTPFTTQVQLSLLGPVMEELKDTPALACVGPRDRHVGVMRNIRAAFARMHAKKMQQLKARARIATTK
jgi:hypothetical protein